MTGWLDLPWGDLAPSVRVDVLGVLAYGKPAIRARVRSRAAAARVAEVVVGVGWSQTQDNEYLVAALTSELATHILNVDQSTQPHTQELGLLLGYPACCARVAAAIGEEHIDAYALRLGTDCDRDGVFLLDPRGYQSGVALVPHIACSPRCPEASRQARAAARYAAAVAPEALGIEPTRTWNGALGLLTNSADTVLWGTS